MRDFLLLLGVAISLGGCAGGGIYQAEPISSHLGAQASGDVAHCARWFAALDSAVDQWGVRDARGSRIAGFPYLRSDRVLSAIARVANREGSFDAWIRLAVSMDEESRHNEIAHLPDFALPVEMGNSREGIEESLRQCRLQLAGADLATSPARVNLRELARPPDEYQSWKRSLGLYPLTSIPFAKGVREWQATTEAVFNTPLAALAKKGKPVSYGPPPRRLVAGDLPTLFSDGARNALGILEWSDTDRETLFSLYAPRILVDEASHDDRIGMLEYDAQARLWVNTFRPVVYRRLSHTFMAGRWLPQFVYSFWFPARTAQSRFDMLAGEFDGLIWRVTVGLDGHPLAYDTIHACGCYHMFFPTEAVQSRPQPESIDESLFSPQSLPRIRSGESLVMHIESGTHYLQRVAHEGQSRESRVYEFAEDDDLRSLRLPNPQSDGPARRSAFDSKGFIKGSERAERYLFWPMGIDNAGAMRQWGRHATAFVGVRHFDDPDLFDKYFEIRK